LPWAEIYFSFPKPAQTVPTSWPSRPIHPHNIPASHPNPTQLPGLRLTRKVGFRCHLARAPPFAAGRPLVVGSGMHHGVRIPPESWARVLPSSKLDLSRISLRNPNQFIPIRLNLRSQGFGSVGARFFAKVHPDYKSNKLPPPIKGSLPRADRRHTKAPLPSPTAAVEPSHRSFPHPSIAWWRSPCPLCRCRNCSHCWSTTGSHRRRSTPEPPPRCQPSFDRFRCHK
jgi:hypothetical protein